jgi:hypothetical protein
MMTRPPFARWRDYDPSRIALLHGDGDFGQRAWRDHAELPDKRRRHSQCQRGAGTDKDRGGFVDGKGTRADTIEKRSGVIDRVRPQPIGRL